jgi:hypothetical protein
MSNNEAARQRSSPVPAALLVLTAIPLTAGALRLIQLAGGPAVIPADHRFADFPLPLVIHILGATTYALVGILQFLPRFRRRWSESAFVVNSTRSASRCTAPADGSTRSATRSSTRTGGRIRQGRWTDSLRSASLRP